MATNRAALHPGAEHLHRDDLRVGQELIHARYGARGWGNPGIRTERKLTIAKITKTRLVLTSRHGAEYRVLIENSSYAPGANGRIKAVLEGSPSYRAAAFELYTVDDPELLATRERDAAARNAYAAKRAAEDTLKQAQASLTNATADAAIAALQAWKAAQA